MTTTAPPRATAREWLGVAALVLPALLASMDLSILFFAIPWISADLAPSATQQLWMMDIYGFVMAGLLITTHGPVLLDSLGPWVAAQVDQDLDRAALVEALVGRRGHTVVVSDEVGLSVHPPTAVGRWFVDALGAVNRAVVAVADETWLVVAGRVVALAPEPVWTADRPR